MFKKKALKTKKTNRSDYNRLHSRSVHAHSYINNNATPGHATQASFVKCQSSYDSADREYLLNSMFYFLSCFWGNYN